MAREKAEKKQTGRPNKAEGGSNAAKSKQVRMPEKPSGQLEKCAETFKERLRDQTALKAEKNGAKRAKIIVDDKAWLVGAAASFGTMDMDLINNFTNQLVNVSQGVTKDNFPEHLNKLTPILRGINPQNELEGMLAVQMVGVHNLAMEMMRRAMLSEQTAEGVDSNVNRATKLLRTFTTQMEALNRHRGKGQQKMTVEHVHVHQGGQAIVGSVNQGGGGRDEK